LFSLRGGVVPEAKPVLVSPPPELTVGTHCPDVMQAPSLLVPLAISGWAKIKKRLKQAISVPDIVSFELRFSFIGYNLLAVFSSNYAYLYYLIQRL
jgi:hypothetical protein